MNNTQAKMVVLLANIPLAQRNVYFLASKLGLSFASAYNYIRLMEAGGQIRKMKQGKKTLLQVTSDEVIAQAQEKLTSEVQVNVLPKDVAGKDN